MLTANQQKRVDHLSDEEKVEIKPYDPSCDEKFEKVKKKIQEKLGKDIEVKHCGATSLKISGQDEIDVYIPVLLKDFDAYILKLTQLFGEAKSCYPMERARFVTEVDRKHIDVFLINKESGGWIRSVKFEKYLKEDPRALKEYRILKEEGNGLSVREYYRRKFEFINKVLAEVG